jgi:hypothetical protein
MFVVVVFRRLDAGRTAMAVQTSSPNCRKCRRRRGAPTPAKLLLLPQSAAKTAGCVILTIEEERPQIVQDAFQHNTSCILIDPTYP